MKKAIIIGSRGQDGTLLFELLQSKNYSLIGIDKNSTQATHGEYNPIDILSKDEVDTIIQTFQPDEIYHLAAYHHSAEEDIQETYEEYFLSHKINTQSVVNFLEAIKKYSPKSKLFYASSSHIFNPEKSIQQTEETAMEPNHIYGITKAESTMLVKHYREEHNIHAISGILYNHNSELRDPKFLLMKIVKTAVEIKKGREKELLLGDLSAKIDLGYAKDYMEAIHHIMQLEKPTDYIISSGELHSVQEIVDIVFKKLGLNVAELIKENKNIIKRKQKPLFGDRTKLLATGWKQKTSFQEMIEIMIESELKKTY